MAAEADRNIIRLATVEEADLWARSRQLGGFTRDWQDALAFLAEHGRLGPFCVWPNPPGYDPAKNVLWMQRHPVPVP